MLLSSSAMSPPNLGWSGPEEPGPTGSTTGHETWRVPTCSVPCPRRRLKLANSVGRHLAHSYGVAASGVTRAATSSLDADKA
jgi:hypothetical protein